jgi:hypothetical protein
MNMALKTKTWSIYGEESTVSTEKASPAKKQLRKR